MPKSPIRRFGALAVSLAFILISSCGYRFAGQGTKLPDTIKTIAIPVFTNNTSEPDLELRVTRAVIDKFQHDGRLEVVPAHGADSVLLCTIERYKLVPSAYDASNRVSVYFIKMRVKIKFQDKVGKKILIEKTMDVEWYYSLSGSITQAEISRLDATYSAAAYLGDKLIGLLLEGF